jgi:DNA polymerase III epsilon subunit-like protein
MEAPTRPDVLADTEFAVVDVETNGLSARRHRVLQVAVVRIRADGTVLDRWSTLVRPGRFTRVGRSSQVHGLTRRHLRQAPRFGDVVPEILSRLQGAVVTGHNVGFDWAFLRRGLNRAGYPTPNAARLCTLRLSRSLDPEREDSHRLVELCARYGIPLDQAHDALADATATARLLPQLLAAAQVTDGDGLQPHLWGDTTAWPVSRSEPAPAARRRLLRWRAPSAPAPSPSAPSGAGAAPATGET